MKVADDYDPRIRQLAVDRVDGRCGYAIEFAPSYATHAAKYDAEEARIRIEVGEDPGMLLCGHAPRHERTHYLGGDLHVCFKCWLRACGCSVPQ